MKSSTAYRIFPLLVVFLFVAGSTYAGSTTVTLNSYSGLSGEAFNGAPDIDTRFGGIWQTSETTSAQGDTLATAYTLVPGEYFLVADLVPGISKFDGTTWQTSITPPPSMGGIQAIGGNGSYWLIGDLNKLVWKYDGTSFTDVSPTSPIFNDVIKDLDWGPDYWLVGDAAGSIQKYDGTSWMDLTASAGLAKGVDSIKWDDTFGYWVIGSEKQVKKFDGSTWTDITSPGMEEIVNAVEGNGTYWLIGGSTGGIQRYDGSTWTDLTSQAGFPDSIHDIEWSGPLGLWLVGGKTGTIKTYDGSVWTDEATGWGTDGFDVWSIAWSEDLNYWLVGGTGGRVKSFDGTSWIDRTSSAGLTDQVKGLSFSPVGPSVRRQLLNPNPHTATTSGNYVYEIEVRATSTSPASTTYSVNLSVDGTLIGTLYVKTDANPASTEVSFAQFDIGASIPQNALFFVDVEPV